MACNNQYVIFRHGPAWLVGLSLALCSMSAPAVTNEARIPDRVTLQLKWTHAFQFAGYYAAREKGYYREAGLDVNIVEATPGVDPIRTVIEGQAQFGVGTSSLLLERKAGKPVVALAVIFQHSPYVLIARHERATQGIHDLIGKRIMLEPQSDELLAYLKAEGIPLDRITRVEHSYDPRDLINGRVDAIAGYVINQPYDLDRANFKYQIYTPRSAGIDFYGDNLFTTEQELRAHPARVKAFRAASLRGWQYAMEHQEEIVDLIIAQYSQRHTRDYHLFEARQMIPLLRPELIEIGYMYPGRWRHIAATYADIGMLPRDFSLKGFLYDPNPKLDLTWLYRMAALVLLLIVAVGAVALHIHRVNRRLARALDEGRRSEAALQAEMVNLNAIFESSPVGMLILDEKSNVVRANAVAIVLAGGCASDVLQHQPGNAMLCVHRANDPRGCGYAPACLLCPLRNGIQAVIAGGGPMRGVELALELIRNGEPRKVWLKVGVEPLLMNGRLCLSVALDDITERKLAEEALRTAKDDLEEKVGERTVKLKEKYDELVQAQTAMLYMVEDLNRQGKELKETQEKFRNTYLYTRSLIEASLDPLVTINAEGKITDVNEATIKATGVSKEKLIGTDFSSYFTEPEKAREGYQQVFVKGFVSDYPLTIRHKDGKLTDVLYNATVYKDDKGNVLGVFAAARDVSELNKLQDKLVRSEKLAVVGQLASSVAHELRNPLGVMKNAIYYLNMLELGKDNPDIKENLGIIAAEIENSDKVISDLLEFSRIKQSDFKPEKINLIIKETLNRLKAPAGIKVVTELGENLPQIQADALQMQQVFYNLAANAIQAIEKGGIVTVSSCVTPDKNIAIAFKDTGCGIPKENMQKIFDPLFSTKAKGTGLGLSVVASLVEGHGGKLEIESEVGKGSIFTVKLPIK